eukprot:TRINITY_DN55772_c0_g1_i1.p1 TRINITY_DN55772_c0_g1~~TRINITY_DN55772_c0_g1_i1.p1  ORF type:complete len:258 (+),score=96.21 TRINITY_DN55772_c0_g1_i1:36-809(+)
MLNMKTVCSRALRRTAGSILLRAGSAVGRTVAASATSSGQRAAVLVQSSQGRWAAAASVASFSSSSSASASSSDNQGPPDDYTFRVPELSKGDGAAMQRVARDSKVLETNTLYCYVMYVDHFGADGCIVVERTPEDGEETEEQGGRRVVGYVQGHRIPERPDTVFVWQVGVDSSDRRRGLARRLLFELASRLAKERDVKYLEATVTPSNTASRKLFRSFARSVDAECVESEHYTDDVFGSSGHEPEDLFRIGPFDLK